MFSFLKSVIGILSLVFVIRGSVFEPFVIPSGSMLPTLQIGDQIFVWKLSYGFRLMGFQKVFYSFGRPSRGEIVVFTREDDPDTVQDESDTNIIKRVIGLPGESLEVRDTAVYINGEPLTESYARWEDGGTADGNFGPVIVPEGKVIVLGDNRDRSKDSRFWTPTPFLPLDNIKGRAFLVYWSWADLSRIGTLIR